MIHRLPNVMMAAESLDWLGQLLVETQHRDVPGDVIECGCHNGFTSLYIQSVIDTLGLRCGFHVFDAFGPVGECATLASEKGDPGFKWSDRTAFDWQFASRHMEHPKVHQGLFEKTIPQDLPPKICLALLDCDYYEPMKFILPHVLARVSKGGVVLIHDYQHYKWGPGVQKAVKEVWFGPIGYDKGLAVLLKP